MMCSATPVTALVTALVTLCLVLLVRGQASTCDTSSCQLPNCRCSTTDTPGGLSSESVPQFVLLTFDDLVSASSFSYYENLTQRYANPNGCAVPMTFFVTHPWTDYSLVSKLYQYGHEIASHTVTHTLDPTGYWTVLSKEEWAQEIVDMKTILATYAQVPMDSITGFRAPYLQLGGDNMYGALSDSGFEYDCSWPTKEYTPWYTGGGGDPKGTLWPYTLDYASVQEQRTGLKPTESFPGLWVNPMTTLQDNIGWGCSMVDFCLSATGELDQSEDAVLDLLKRNFDTNYYGARAPYGVYMHYYWFEADATHGNTAHTGGFERFLDYALNLPDVYVVTVQQLLEWTRNPVPLEDIGSFLQCPPRPSTCPTVTTCHYTGDLPVGSEVWMPACLDQCPARYPWLENPYGNP